MREILFRVFCAKTKVMWDDAPLLHFCGDDWWGSCGIYNTFSKLSGDVLMQFTGLHDKNGQKIFEGDIIQNKALEYSNKFWVVEFDRSCFGSKGMALRAMIGMEVVGNIYENPELLEQL